MGMTSVHVLTAVSSLDVCDADVGRLAVSYRANLDQGDVDILFAAGPGPGPGPGRLALGDIHAATTPTWYRSWALRAVIFAMPW